MVKSYIKIQYYYKVTFGYCILISTNDTKYGYFVCINPGISDNHLQWMHNTAVGNNVPQHGRVGMLLVDEMYIQVSIVFINLNKFV